MISALKYLLIILERESCALDNKILDETKYKDDINDLIKYYNDSSQTILNEYLKILPEYSLYSNIVYLENIWIVYPL